MTTESSIRRHNLCAIASLVIVSFLLPRAPAGAIDTAAGPLDETFVAHGGLKQWRMQRQMTYSFNGFPLSAQVARPNRSTVDLKNRFNRIEGEGFVVGFLPLATRLRCFFGKPVSYRFPATIHR